MLAFSKDQFSKTFASEVCFLKLEEDWLSKDGFFFGIANPRKKWMVKAVLQRDAVVWIEYEDFLQEIDCLRRRSRVLLLQIGARSTWELLQVLKCFQIGDETLVRLSGCANDLEDNGKLVVGGEWESFALFSWVFSR